MADAKISALTAGTVLAANDEFVFVDKSDTAQAATGSTRKILVSTILADPIFNAGYTGAGAPGGTGTDGQTYYDTTNDRYYLSDGVGWVIMAEPVNTSTATCQTGISADASCTFSTTYHRSDGWIDIVSTITFGSGPSTLSSLAWQPIIAGIAIPTNTMRVAFYDASAGGWYQGTHNEGTSSLTLFSHFVTGTQIGIQNVTTAAPFLWTISDRIIVSGRYRMTTRYS